MRSSFLALAVAAVGGFALANCGSSSNNNGGDMGQDLAGVSGAMDMATAPKLNCLGVGNCVLQCVVSNTGAIDTCFTMCGKQAKTGSANKWASAFTCGQDYCFPPTDMMGKCVEVTNPANAGQSSLCAPGQTYADCTAANAPPNICTTCIANARNLIWGDFSTDPPGPPTGVCPDGASAPDCKGGAMCSTMMNACISDM